MTRNLFKNAICILLTVTLLASLSVMSVVADGFEAIDIDFEDNTLGTIITTGMQKPTIVTVAKGTNTTNKAIKLGSSWSGSIATGMIMGEEGVYEISFSMMSNATLYQAGQTDRDKNFAVFLNKGTTTAAIIKNGYIRQSLDATGSWNGNGTMFAVTAGEWLDVELIINTKTNTVVSATYTQGANTQTVENISLGNHDYTTIYLYNNAITDSYVDDIKVKPYVADEEDGGDITDEEDETPSYNGVNIDFEDNTLTGVNGASETSLSTVSRGTNANNKALKLEKSWSGTIETGMTANSGIYEISFSMYPETIAGNNAVFFKDKTQAAVLVTYTNNNYVKQSIDTSNGSWNAKWVFDSKVGEWIDVKLIIDTATDTVTSATYTQGAKSVTVTQTAANEDLSVSAANYATLILYGNDGDECYIDDIVIKKVVKGPKIDISRVTMVDMDDNPVSVTDTVVNPIIDKITLDFGTELDSSSLDDITFTDSEGETVPGIVSVRATKGLYIFDVDGFLKPNETYTIIVPASVKNINDETLGEEFVYQFTTASGVSVEIVGLCDEAGNSYNSPESMVPGEKANAKVRYLNATYADSAFVCLISYYKNDMMVFSEVAQGTTVNAFSHGEAEIEFGIPEIQGITDVRVFVIDDNVSGIPLCNALNPFME